jgi:hypothetical protein
MAPNANDGSSTFAPSRAHASMRVATRSPSTSSVMHGKLDSSARVARRKTLTVCVKSASCDSANFPIDLVEHAFYGR